MNNVATSLENRVGVAPCPHTAACHQLSPANAPSTSPQTTPTWNAARAIVCLCGEEKTAGEEPVAMQGGLKEGGGKR